MEREPIRDPEGYGMSRRVTVVESIGWAIATPDIGDAGTSAVVGLVPSMAVRPQD